MADRKIISISVDPATYSKIEMLSKKISGDLYEDISKSMVVRAAICMMYENLIDNREVDHEKDSM